MTAPLESFVSVVRNQYPELKDRADLKTRLEPIVADRAVDLPLSFYKFAQETVQTLFRESRTPERLQRLKAKLTQQNQLKEIEILERRPRNYSVLMAYDFHFDPQSGQISLIEINTNASGYLLADAVYRAQNIDPYASAFSPLKGLSPLEVLRRSFERESQLCHHRNPRAIALVDENIEQQKMYLEFLMYRSLFRQWGYESEIFEVDRVPLERYDVIYNRHTDFLLNETKVRNLLEAFWDGHVCLTPNPFEYLVLSHKERLIEFAEERLVPTLIPTVDIKTQDREAIWADRKKWFFKPKAMYGAKAVYRGSSISRKKFDEIFQQDFIAQEYRPPGEVAGWKYDIRCYAYADEIQLIAARLYQGQVTNFTTPGGGYAPVRFR